MMKYKLKKGVILPMFDSFQGLPPVKFHELNNGKSVELNKKDADRLSAQVEAVKKKEVNHGH